MLRSRRQRAAGVLVFVALMAGSDAGLVGGAHAATAPPGRGYELVSPPDKNGGDVMAYSPRTRASADGDAVAFGSLVGFGDLQGTGAGIDYLAERSGSLNRWVTHAISPLVPSNSVKALAGAADTYYDGDFTTNLEQGIVTSVTPVTQDAGTKGVANLYRRSDLRASGSGTYALVTRCPLCDATSSPLSPLSGSSVLVTPYLPQLAGASADMEHVAFTSIQSLASDVPAQSAFCGSANPNMFIPPNPLWCAPHVYEWDHGEVRLASILPDGTPADAAGAGGGTAPSVFPTFVYTPHVVSDGSDGHSRIVFTQFTNASGTTLSQLDPADVFGQAFLLVENGTVTHGNVFLRVDHTQTVQMNRSERADRTSFGPAQYLDAAANDDRVFFMTAQMLTRDAQPGGQKVYMYDATKPDAADNLTLVSPPSGNAAGLIGVSDDGRYAYLIDGGRILLWHDGTLQDIGPEPFTGFTRSMLLTSGTNYGETLRQAQVTPDGRHVAFVTDQSLDGHDHGTCPNGFGCREVYVYSADNGALTCTSCPRPGSSPTHDASLVADALHGGARVTSHQAHELSNDGRFVFFNTAEALVAEDTNGKVDAYVYDMSARRAELLSSGEDASDSYFVDSSGSGQDAFFVTRERLVGWDRDDQYDLYDARVGGGFPDPPPIVPACSAGTCQGAPSVSPATAAPASAVFRGAGNASARLRALKTRAGCKRGPRQRTVRGKRRCVKRRAHHARRKRRGS